MSQIVLPPLGEEILNATVACWHKKVGEAVRKDDDIVELVTDKASFNVPAPANGILQAINAAEGEVVAIGAVLGVIEPKGK